jgi:hypothetical protein
LLLALWQLQNLGTPRTVALANKLARIIWAIMRTGEIFRAEIFAKA